MRWERDCRPALVLLTSVFLAGCDSLLDVENTTSVGEDDLRNAQSAELWANGVHRSVQEGWDGMLLLTSTAADEFRFVGAHQWWEEIDRGRVADPENAGLNDSFRRFASAQWLVDEAIQVLDSLYTGGDLAHTTPLARVYLYGAIAYTTLGDGLEDYAPADRTEPGPALGPENMASLYDTAVAYATRGMTLEIGPELRRNLTAARARARHARAIRRRIQPPPADVTGGGLVYDVGAVQDARDALDSDPGDWRFEFTYPPQVQSSQAKFEHCFGNLRFGDRYVVPEAGSDMGAEEVILLDPLDGVPDPWIERFILSEFYHEGPCDTVDLTVLSAREMHLILAEAALFDNDVEGFAEHVKAVRAWGGLTPWTPESGVSPRDLLIYERQSQLFATGRRLTDLYRFDLQSDRWEPSSVAVTLPGSLFPISQREVDANCHLNGSC